MNYEDYNKHINKQYGKLLNKAYKKYKTIWCSERGYILSEVNEETGINGECYVCKKEFESSEFRDIQYMESILRNDDFELYKQLLIKRHIQTEIEDCEGDIKYWLRGNNYQAEQIAGILELVADKLRQLLMIETVDCKLLHDLVNDEDDDEMVMVYHDIMVLPILNCV